MKLQASAHSGPLEDACALATTLHAVENELDCFIPSIITI